MPLLPKFFDSHHGAATLVFAASMVIGGFGGQAFAAAIPPVKHSSEALPVKDAARVKAVRFGNLTDLSLGAESSDPPLIQRAVGTSHAEVLEVRAQPRFSAAPLPNEDMEAPAENTESGAELRPDFFQRDPHLVGDALANGANDNAQRRGHGGMAAGVALAVPVD